MDAAAQFKRILSDRAWVRSVVAGSLLATGCGFLPAPAMTVGVTCQHGDLTLQLEQGYPGTGADGLATADDCQRALDALDGYRAEYEARFGVQDLGNRPVRLRTATDLTMTTDALNKYASLNDCYLSGSPPGQCSIISGNTYADSIDLARNNLLSFPHELNHVRRGLGHSGWCIDYNPWSISVLGWDQSGYLGCSK